MLHVLHQKLATFLSRFKVLCFTPVKAAIGLAVGLVIYFVFTHYYSSFPFGILFALGFILLGLFRLDFSNLRAGILCTNILCGLLPLLCLFAVCYISLDFIDLTITKNLAPELLFLNLLCSFVIYCILFAVTGNSTAAAIISVFILMSMSTVNGFVFLFRGKELCAADLLSVGTAVNVAGQYNYFLPPHIVVRWAIALLLNFSLLCLPVSYTSTLKARLSYLGLALASSILLMVASKDISVKTWEYQGSQLNGFYLNFYLGLRDSLVEEPEGYSPLRVNELSDNYADISTSSEFPHVIVIMNEAFSDFSIFENSPVDIGEYMPFISSLEKNTIKGHSLVSVFAGSTANSEFEFLFGHTLSFFPNPTGVVPYQQYISSDMACLPWLMSSYGYNSFATHPYIANGWSRDVVYPLMGFLRFDSVEKYEDKELIRNYISDRGMYTYILENLYSHKTGSPLFLFGITMQNHSSYDYSGENYVKTIEISNTSNKYPLAEQYLSLIKESDRAVEYLLSELEDYPEDTVVLFFGDHMPKIEDEFYALLNGGTPDSLDEQMLKYTVPFFIWANYDIEEYTLEQTSLNYLAGHLLDAAGIELPPYYQFLRDTENVVPAINAFGYYSKDQGRMIPLDEAEGKEAEAIRNYEYVQYNNMFDANNRNELFFGQYLPE